MNDRHRLDQLGVLLDRLERLPASPNRDWMIGEVRSRRVDLDTGVRPGPIRARQPDAAIPPSGAARRGPAERRDVDRPMEIHQAASQPAPAPSHVGLSGAPPSEVVRPAPSPAPPASRDGRIDVLERSDVLCLGDLPAEPLADAGHAGPRPWARGLRG